MGLLALILAVSTIAKTESFTTVYEQPQNDAARRVYNRVWVVPNVPNYPQVIPLQNLPQISSIPAVIDHRPQDWFIPNLNANIAHLVHENVLREAEPKESETRVSKNKKENARRKKESSEEKRENKETESREVNQVDEETTKEDASSSVENSNENKTKRKELGRSAQTDSNKEKPQKEPEQMKETDESTEGLKDEEATTESDSEYTDDEEGDSSDSEESPADDKTNIPEVAKQEGNNDDVTVLPEIGKDMRKKRDLHVDINLEVRSSEKSKGIEVTNVEIQKENNKVVLPSTLAIENVKKDDPNPTIEPVSDAVFNNTQKSSTEKNTVEGTASKTDINPTADKLQVKNIKLKYQGEDLIRPRRHVHELDYQNVQAENAYPYNTQTLDLSRSAQDTVEPSYAGHAQVSENEDQADFEQLNSKEIDFDPDENTNKDTEDKELNASTVHMISRYSHHIKPRDVKLEQIKVNKSDEHNNIAPKVNGEIKQDKNHQVVEKSTMKPVVKHERSTRSYHNVQSVSNARTGHESENNGLHLEFRNRYSHRIKPRQSVQAENDNKHNFQHGRQSPLTQEESKNRSDGDKLSERNDNAPFNKHENSVIENDQQNYGHYLHNDGLELGSFNEKRHGLLEMDSREQASHNFDARNHSEINFNDLPKHGEFDSNNIESINNLDSSLRNFDHTPHNFEDNLNEISRDGSRSYLDNYVDDYQNINARPSHYQNPTKDDLNTNGYQERRDNHRVNRIYDQRKENFSSEINQNPDNNIQNNQTQNNIESRHIPYLHDPRIHPYLLKSRRLPYVPYGRIPYPYGDEYGFLSREGDHPNNVHSEDQNASHEKQNDLRKSSEQAESAENIESRYFPGSYGYDPRIIPYMHRRLRLPYLDDDKNDKLSRNGDKISHHDSEGLKMNRENYLNHQNDRSDHENNHHSDFRKNIQVQNTPTVKIADDPYVSRQNNNYPRVSPHPYRRPPYPPKLDHNNFEDSNNKHPDTTENNLQSIDTVKDRNTRPNNPPEEHNLESDSLESRYYRGPYSHSYDPRILPYIPRRFRLPYSRYMPYLDEDYRLSRNSHHLPVQKHGKKILAESIEIHGEVLPHSHKSHQSHEKASDDLPNDNEFYQSDHNPLDLSGEHFLVSQEHIQHIGKNDQLTPEKFKTELHETILLDEPSDVASRNKQYVESIDHSRNYNLPRGFTKTAQQVTFQFESHGSNTRALDLSFVKTIDDLKDICLSLEFVKLICSAMAEMAGPEEVKSMRAKLRRLWDAGKPLWRPEYDNLPIGVNFDNLPPKKLTNIYSLPPTDFRPDMNYQEKNEKTIPNIYDEPRIPALQNNNALPQILPQNIDMVKPDQILTASYINQPDNGNLPSLPKLPNRIVTNLQPSEFNNLLLANQDNKPSLYPGQNLPDSGKFLTKAPHGLNLPEILPIINNSSPIYPKPYQSLPDQHVPRPFYPSKSDNLPILPYNQNQQPESVENLSYKPNPQYGNLPNLPNWRHPINKTSPNHSWHHGLRPENQYDLPRQTFIPEFGDDLPYPNKNLHDQRDYDIDQRPHLEEPFEVNHLPRKPSLLNDIPRTPAESPVHGHNHNNPKDYYKPYDQKIRPRSEHLPHELTGQNGSQKPYHPDNWVNRTQGVQKRPQFMDHLLTPSYGNSRPQPDYRQRGFMPRPHNQNLPQGHNTGHNNLRPTDKHYVPYDDNASRPSHFPSREFSPDEPSADRHKNMLYKRQPHAFPGNVNYFVPNRRPEDQNRMLEPNNHYNQPNLNKHVLSSNKRCFGHHLNQGLAAECNYPNMGVSKHHKVSTEKYQEVTQRYDYGQPPYFLPGNENDPSKRNPGEYGKKFPYLPDAQPSDLDNAPYLAYEHDESLPYFPHAILPSDSDYLPIVPHSNELGKQQQFPHEFSADTNKMPYLPNNENSGENLPPDEIIPVDYDNVLNLPFPYVILPNEDSKLPYKTPQAENQNAYENIPYGVDINDLNPTYISQPIADEDTYYKQALSQFDNDMANLQKNLHKNEVIKAFVYMLKGPNNNENGKVYDNKPSSVQDSIAQYGHIYDLSSLLAENNRIPSVYESLPTLMNDLLPLQKSYVSPNIHNWLSQIPFYRKNFVPIFVCDCDQEVFSRRKNMNENSGMDNTHLSKTNDVTERTDRVVIGDSEDEIESLSNRNMFDTNINSPIPTISVEDFTESSKNSKIWTFANEENIDKSSIRGKVSAEAVNKETSKQKEDFDLTKAEIDAENITAADNNIDPKTSNGSQEFDTYDDTFANVYDETTIPSPTTLNTLIAYRRSFVENNNKNRNPQNRIPDPISQSPIEDFTDTFQYAVSRRAGSSRPLISTTEVNKESLAEESGDRKVNDSRVVSDDRPIPRSRLDKSTEIKSRTGQNVNYSDESISSEEFGPEFDNYAPISNEIGSKSQELVPNSIEQEDVRESMEKNNDNDLNLNESQNPSVDTDNNHETPSNDLKRSDIIKIPAENVLESTEQPWANNGADLDKLSNNSAELDINSDDVTSINSIEKTEDNTSINHTSTESEVVESENKVKSNARKTSNSNDLMSSITRIMPSSG